MTCFKQTWESNLERALLHPYILPKSCLSTPCTILPLPLLYHYLTECTPCQNCDPPLLLFCLKSLPLRYFLLNEFMHELSSPLSSLKIHLHNKAAFIALVSMNPRPPNSLGLSRASYLSCGTSCFPLIPKELTSS